MNFGLISLLLFSLCPREASETFKPTCRLALNHRARAKSIRLFLMKTDGQERQKPRCGERCSGDSDGGPQTKAVP